MTVARHGNSPEREAKQIGHGAHALNASDLLAGSAQLPSLLELNQRSFRLTVSLLRAFVVAALRAEPVLWEPFGFSEAFRLASRINHSDEELAILSPDEVEELIATLRTAADRKLSTRQKHAAEWPVASALALSRLEEAEEAHRGTWRRSLPFKPADPPSRDEAQILVPVVEKLRSSRDLHPMFGAVSASTVVLLHVGAIPRFLGRDGPTLTVDGSLDEDARSGMKTALLHLGQFSTGAVPGLRKCDFRVSWTGTKARLTGRSASAAFALAAATAWARLGPKGVERSIVPGTAATGNLEGTRIRAVEPGTLAAKVRACFFAGVRHLIVPADQVEAALTEVRDLQSRMPGRQLWVEGVEDIREAWRDRQVVAGETPRFDRGVSSLLLWLSHSPVFVGVLLFVALAAAGLVGRELYLSRNAPVTVRREGDWIVGTNPSGRDVVHIQVPFLPERDYLQDGMMRYRDVVDADGDGRNELLVISGREENWLDFMTLFNRRAEVIWRARSDSTGVLPPNLEEDLLWQGFFPLPFGEPQVLAYRRSRQGSLTAVQLIDLRQGHILATILNQGHLERLNVVDVQGDGELDYLVCGTHNPSNMGIMCILTPGNLHDLSDRAVLSPVHWMTDAEILEGVATVVLRFPPDRFSYSHRVSITQGTREGGGLLAVTARDPGDKHEVIYTMDFSVPRRPLLLGVRYTESGRGILRAGLDAPNDHEMDAEERLLQKRVEILSEDGFRPLLEASKEPAVRR
jgi:hypothetical protein